MVNKSNNHRGRPGGWLPRTEHTRCTSPKGTLAQQDICWMLEPWIGNKNVVRKSVTPDGWDHVRSDTVGLVTTHQGEVRVGNLTWRHPMCAGP